MKENILVTYASVSGSTGEVAEAIVKVLRQEGGQAIARPVDQIISLDEFDAVIIGSSIRAGRWLPDAVAFVVGLAA